MDELDRNRSPQADHDSSERDARAREDACKNGKRSSTMRWSRAWRTLFPGSDPVSVTQPPASAYDKHGK